MRVVENDFGRAQWRGGQAGSAELFNLAAKQPGHGQGAALLATVFEAMRREGCAYVYLFSEGHNAAAHRFFERNGFKRLAGIEGFYTHDRAVLFGRLL
jgi:ribosomal protein S18 acetylase RimI-like enzyme